jgi:hypothetical protein
MGTGGEGLRTRNRHVAAQCESPEVADHLRIETLDCWTYTRDITVEHPNALTRCRHEGIGKMDEQQHVFLIPSPEVQELLADNEISLVDILQQEGVAIEHTAAPHPTAGPDTGHKEPVTVIFASAALVAALTPTILRIIGALTHKQVVVVAEDLVPVEDSKGNVVRDASGDPILVPKTRTEIIESSRAARDTTTVDLKGPMQISISLKTEQRG